MNLSPTGYLCTVYISVARLNEAISQQFHLSDFKYTYSHSVVLEMVDHLALQQRSRQMTGK